MNDEHTKFLYTDNVPNVFPELQENVPKKLSKILHSVFERICGKPSRRITTGNTKSGRNKIQRRNSSTRAKKNRNKKTRAILSSRKGIELISIWTPSTINRLSRNGKVCFDSSTTILTKV